MPRSSIDPYDFLPLPDLAFHVLLALGEGEAHGWAIIKRIGDLAPDRKPPSSGSLYLSMVRLEERGLIAGAKAPAGGDDPRRRYYKLTSLGRRVLAAEATRLAHLVDHARRLGVGARTRGR